jgi:hypothetical protein
MPDGDFYFLFLKVFGTELNSNWGSFDLPMSELKAWVMMRIYIDCASNATCLKLVIQLVNLVVECFVISVFVKNRDQNCLDLGHARRQHKTRVV